MTGLSLLWPIGITVFLFVASFIATACDFNNIGHVGNAIMLSLLVWIIYGVIK